MWTSSCMSPFWGPKGAAKFDELPQVNKKNQGMCADLCSPLFISAWGLHELLLTLWTQICDQTVDGVVLSVNCSAESLFLKSLSTHQIAALILQKESFCSHTSYSHTSYSGYFSTMEEKKSLLSLLWCEMGIHFAKKYQRQPSKPELKSCLQGFWNEPEPSAWWIQTEAEREKSGLIVQLIRQVEKGAFFLPKGWCSEAKMTASENRVCGINTVRIFPQ